MLDPNNWYETTECDGTVQTIVDNKECLIPMQTLRASPFFYILNDQIRIRIWAYNAEGLGSFQTLGLLQTGNNALIQTEPSAPSIAIQNFLDTTNDL